MNRTPVSSSNIRSVGFEGGEMEIEFSNGRVYRYTGPKVEAHYKGLMAADSIGKYFGVQVRPCQQTQARLVTDDSGVGESQ